MAIRYLDQPQSSNIQYVDQPDVKAIRDQIEPGVMGETSPTGQRLLENATTAAGGYFLPGAVESLASIPSGVKSLMSNSPSTILKAIAKSPAELSPEFDAGKAAAGISEDLPIQRGTAARFPQPERIVPTKQPIPIAKAETLPFVPPVSYPKDPASALNFIRARVAAFGSRLSPQELNDSKVLLTNMMNEGKIVGGTEPFAVAAKLKKAVTELHNDAIPGREELNKVYALSKSIHPDVGEWIASGLKKFGKRVVDAAVIATGVGTGMNFGGGGK